MAYIAMDIASECRASIAEGDTDCLPAEFEVFKFPNGTCPTAG